MNKKILYLLSFILYLLFIHPVSGMCSGIPKDSGVYISLNFCGSFPIGNFKSPGGANIIGYAMNGYGANIVIEHPVKPGWGGLAFTASYYLDQFNVAEFNTTLNSRPTGNNNFPAYGYTYNSTTPYTEAPILVGLFLEDSYKKFTFELKGMAGIDLLTMPSVSGTDSSYNKAGYGPFTGIFTIEATSYNLACFYTEASVRYSLSEHFVIRGNAGYFNAFPGGSGVYSSIPLSQFHLELGLAYHIL